MPDAMALVRGLHLAAMLSLLGTTGFVAWVMPVAMAVPDPLRRRLKRLWWVSGTVAVVAGVAWFVLQTVAIAGAETLSDLRDALPVVAEHTRYGNVVMVRVGLLLVATVLAVEWRRAGTSAVSPGGDGKSWGAGPGPTRVLARPATPQGGGPGPSAAHKAVPAVAQVGGAVAVPLAIFLSVIAIGLQGLIGHAGATGGAVGEGLVLSEALHLIAAGVWLGALLPLLVALRALAPGQAAAVCERFSPIGLACVLVLAGTGFAQALELIGSLPALLGTRYGHFALLKITLFLLALVLAAINRLWLTDRLTAGISGARRQLGVSVCVETCIGLAIVTAAAFMASSPPAAHTTPVWPFSWQFSLVTVNEDPDFRREVAISLAAIGGATALLVGTLVWRRFRVVAAVLLAMAVVWFGPSLSLLTVEAYPTSFQTSPTGFSAASIMHGAAVYAANCVACHGADGSGNGPAAAGLRIKPADLTMPHVWEHSDGEMFWWLTHGIDDPEGNGLAMPGFGDTLSADDRWALIDYVRAHNAGLAMEEGGAFDVPVPAPAFAVRCAGVAASVTSDLRGHAVHVVASAVALTEVPPQDGISTITLVLRDDASPAPGGCVAADSAARGAYAVLAGLAPDAFEGTEFLVDPNGWLRAVRRADGGWPKGEDVIAAVRGICTHPIQPPGGGQHEHHH